MRALSSSTPLTGSADAGRSLLFTPEQDESRGIPALARKPVAIVPFKKTLLFMLVISLLLNPEPIKVQKKSIEVTPY